MAERTTRRLQLLVESNARDGAPTPAFTAVGFNERVRYLAKQRGASCAPGLQLVDDEPAGGARIAFEAVQSDQRPALLMLLLEQHDRDVRLNGLPAPRVAVVHSGDELLVDDRPIFAATYNEPPVAEATDEQIGQACPFCRGPVARGDVVYTCPSGCAAVHQRSTPREPNGDRLECVTLMRRCCTCQRPLILTEGWTDVPQTS